MSEKRLIVHTSSDHKDGPVERELARFPGTSGRYISRLDGLKR